MLSNSQSWRNEVSQRCCLESSNSRLTAGESSPPPNQDQMTSICRRRLLVPPTAFGLIGYSNDCWLSWDVPLTLPLFFYFWQRIWSPERNLVSFLVGRSTFRSANWTQRQTKYWIYGVVSLKIMHDSTNFAVFRSTEYGNEWRSRLDFFVKCDWSGASASHPSVPASGKYVLIDQHSANKTESQWNSACHEDQFDVPFMARSTSTSAGAQVSMPAIGCLYLWCIVMTCVPHS